MSINDNFVEKKLRGSGGYAIAKVNDQEQKKANLGGPELFLAGIGRLDEKRFVKYYCNRCEKEYKGEPKIQFENPNEDLGENVILIEKGEYRCKSCDYVIAQYRKFNEGKDEEKSTNNESKSTDTNTSPVLAETKVNSDEGKKGIVNDTYNIQQQAETSMTGTTTSNINTITNSDYKPIEKMIGMPIYDSEANLVGRISEIGLRKISNQIKFSFKVKDSINPEIKEITWDNISKIGDIIILKENNINEKKEKTETNEKGNKICANCNKENDPDSIFCEDCGKKLQ